MVKRQEMGNARAARGELGLLVVNVPKRLLHGQATGASEENGQDPLPPKGIASPAQARGSGRCSLGPLNSRGTQALPKGFGVD